MSDLGDHKSNTHPISWRSMTFCAVGQPVPTARARTTKSGHTYTPKKTVDYQTQIAECASLRMAGENLKMVSGEPLSLEVTFYLAKPKKMKHKDYPIGKPDTSNLLKGIEDGMNGVVYHDDSAIVHLEVSKLWTDSQPCAWVTVRRLGKGWEKCDDDI